MTTILETDHLTHALKQHFGYDSFRLYQREIVEDVLARRDVFALLPTGGGKSLCFQLAALLQEGLTVVVSPLIALMKDQVDGLLTNGIPATFLNSSLSNSEVNQRFHNLYKNQYKLLYVAPERLVLPEFFQNLNQWNVKLFAIDEAHCISEWGHDFRPEYRRLESLRDQFPEVPIMALTATATARVQTDICSHLKLNQPHCYVASFNRPNLTYRVVGKEKPFQQLLAFLKERPTDSGIVYCQSRRSTEECADQLNEEGVKAKPYHAGLTSDLRTEHQDLFLKDDIQVICATIAFGMGINKSNVRFVVHYDLPKNVEGYYQETGRAGRDGLPSECLLFYRSSDASKIQRFIREKEKQEERRIAQKQLEAMVSYAESRTCRRETLLSYFGESLDQENCQSCDSCLTPRQTFDGTLVAQKFLSCIYRVHERQGFGMGLNHIVDILIGAQTEKVLKWNHENLSTYGIGRENSKAEWKSLGRECIRLGYAEPAPQAFDALSLTEAGWDVLSKRKDVVLTKPMVTLKQLKRLARQQSGTEKKGGPPADPDLFQRLKGVRRRLAEARRVPAYLIFSDASLKHMAAIQPITVDEFVHINGVGLQKQKEFGEIFTQEIRNYLADK